MTHLTYNMIFIILSIKENCYLLLLKHKNKQTVLRWSQLANRKINCDVMFTDVNRFG